MKSTYALLVTGLAAQQAAAHWNFFDNYGTPNYSKNVCNDKQKGGFDWADLKDGQSVGNYGDFDFSGGWKCSNSFGKRDSMSKRTFGNKCIKNTVSKDKPAAFGCSERGFSITHMDVSSEFDAEIELHYKMEDGSLCKQQASCSAGGSTLQNTQCGGAKSVEVYLGSHYKGDKDSCEIGFHNIGFDCNAETPYTTPSPPEVPSTSSEVVSSTIVVESSTAPISSTISSAVETPASSAVETPSTSSAVETPASSSAVETSATSVNECGQYGAGCSTSVETPLSSTAPFTNSSIPAYTPSASSVVVIESSSVVEVSSTPASIPSISTATPQPESSTAEVPSTSQSSVAAGCGYGESCEQSSVVASSTVASSAVVSSAIVSSAVYSSGTPLPATSSGTPLPATSSGTPLPATSSVAPQPSSPSYPPVDITDTVPKCMNSWLQISAPDCKDNTDSSCYCVKPEFTKNVIDCISARCGSDDETSKALQYFIGICAEHVPKNPSIIEDCPSYIPLNPTPAAPSGGASTGVASSSKVPEAAESSYIAAPPAGGESSVAPSVPASSAPAPSAPAPSAPAPSAPAPSAPAQDTSSAYGPGYPGETPAVPTQGTTTVPAPSIPAPSAPASSAPAPSAPAPSAPSAPAPSAPAQDTSSAYGPGYPGETPAVPTQGTTTVPAGETPAITAVVSSATMTQVVGTTTPAPEAPSNETPAVETPCTTITFGTTTLTVPQVHFTTQTNSAGANPTEPVALVPGTAEPAQTPAATTAPAAGGAPYPVPSTMGTATVPMGTATGTGAIRPSSPAEFTGAASPFTMVPKGALFGAALAFFAL